MGMMRTPRAHLSLLLIPLQSPMMMTPAPAVTQCCKYCGNGTRVSWTRLLKHLLPLCQTILPTDRSQFGNKNGKEDNGSNGEECDAGGGLLEFHRPNEYDQYPSNSNWECEEGCKGHPASLVVVPSNLENRSSVQKNKENQNSNVGVKEEIGLVGVSAVVEESWAHHLVRMRCEEPLEIYGHLNRHNEEERDELVERGHATPKSQGN